MTPAKKSLSVRANQDQQGPVTVHEEDRNDDE